MCYAKDYVKTEKQISKLRNRLWEKHKGVCIALSIIVTIIGVTVQMITYSEVRKARDYQNKLEELEDSSNLFSSDNE